MIRGKYEEEIQTLKIAPLYNEADLNLWDQWLLWMYEKQINSLIYILGNKQTALTVIKRVVWYFPQSNILIKSTVLRVSNIILRKSTYY